MLDLLGWIGSVLLGLCAVPQAWHSYKTKSSEGVSWLFLLMWLTGEACLFFYVLPRGQWQLLLNYSLNIACLAVILRYKLKNKADTWTLPL